MTQLPAQLDQLGRALERAATARLADARASRPRWRRRPVVVAIAALAIAAPGAAIAASELIGADEVADSIPAGTLWLAGTQPTCSIVKEGVEFQCRLGRAPGNEIADWKGTVEPTVDRSRHVNGGCRSLDSEGRRWQCYIGQAAVDQQIIGPQLLGEFAPAPGVG